MTTRKSSLRRAWEDGFDLAFVSMVLRLPGLAWGCHLFSNAPFMFLSWDEWAVSTQLPGWLANVATLRKDYVYGFAREMELALPIARLLGNATVALHILISTRLLNILLGAATVAVLYRLARLLNVDRATALLAGALLAVAPLHVATSGYATPTISLVFWVYLSFYAFLSFRTTEQPLYWLLGCAAAGTAIAVKFGFVCLIPMAYLLVRPKKSFLINVGGLLAFAGAFYFFNLGDLPWKHLSEIQNILVMDNFAERVHPRWFNPVMFIIDLVPSLGLPTFVCLAFGFRGYEEAATAASRGPVSRVDRFACVELPLLVYFASIWSLTSAFLRHLVLVLPFLCLVAAQGWRRVESMVTERRGARAARILLLLMGAYQLLSVGWLAKQHLTNRVWLGMKWVENNVPPAMKVYIAERNQYDIVWKRDLPTRNLTPDFDQAHFYFVTENIVWRFGRSNSRRSPRGRRRKRSITTVT